MLGTLSRLVALLLTLWPASAWAGEGWLGWHHHNCPHTLYSPLHTWAPGLYKVRANLHPANQYLFPVNTTPGLQPQFQTLRYPCPPVLPPAHPYGDPLAPARPAPVTN